MNIHSASPASYRPRRVRSGRPPPFQVTERDIDIIRLVARYRFLGAHHLRRLVSGSDKNITNRLKALFEHRYLDRPQCQYDYYRPGGGSSPIAYALADRGACLLAQSTKQGQRAAWTNKNNQVGRPFLEHTLAIADLAVALNAAIQNEDDLELVDGNFLLDLLPEETRNLQKPYRLNVPVVHHGTRHDIGVEPDYAFTLVFPRDRRRAFFLAEVDRGTMPIERHDLKQTSILRKLLAYQTLWKAKRHHSHFGWRNFRVLFVTESNERADNMRTAMNSHALTKGSPLFLFTSKDDLYADNILAHEWHDGEGKRHRLKPA
jgi:protein involved in plasmid replication-relaxation